jgi:hypothetical protein
MSKQADFTLYLMALDQYKGLYLWRSKTNNHSSISSFSDDRDLYAEDLLQIDIVAEQLRADSKNRPKKSRKTAPQVPITN